MKATSLVEFIANFGAMFAQIGLHVVWTKYLIEIYLTASLSAHERNEGSSFAENEAVKKI